MKYIPSAILVLLIILVGNVMYCRLNPKVITKTVTKTKVIKVKDKDNIVTLSMEDLQNDLKNNATFLSTKNRLLVINSIEEASKKYDINPIILYGLIYTESSFRYWIKHKAVIINKKKEQAIGLAGVMYSWWGEKLKKENIIETKSDLFGIRENILSCAFILNELKQKPLLKGTKNKTVSGLRRYFGGNYKWYSQKIENKIGKLIFKKVYN